MRAADRGATVAGALAPVVVWSLVAAAGIWWTDGFYFVVAEDKMFEWVQVAGFAVAGAGCLAVALSVRDRSARAATVAALAGAFFVVVVGEELAWGQRLLGVSVPALEEVNQQGDVSLHNVGAGLTLSQLGLLGIALVGLLSRPVAKTVSARRQVPVPWAYLPPPFLTTWFGLAAAFTAARLCLPMAPARVAKFSEVAELTVALAAAISAVRLARAVSSGGRPMVTAGTALSGQ